MKKSRHFTEEVRTLLVTSHWPELGGAKETKIVVLHLGSLSSQYIRVLFLRKRVKEYWVVINTL